MSVVPATGATSGGSLKSVAVALETAVRAATDGAADARTTVEKAVPIATRFISRSTYATSYTLSYGLVFPVVLIAKSIPANNAVVHGLVDGARAAVNMVERLQTRQTVSLPSEAIP
jgi:hypothetical protein